MSFHDHVADFISFMEANGVEPAESIASRLTGGDLIRFQCKGDRGRKNGWAILYLDERPAGAFGNYKQNTGTLKWKANSDGPILSQAERDALQREWREKKAEREAERLDAQKQASLDAADIWTRSTAASADHPYVKAKVLRHMLLRQDGNKLLVPMYDDGGTLWNLQRISPDGTKRFLEGGRVQDLFTIIGTIDKDAREIVLCEGYSTGDAIYQSVGLPVVVAFNTGNLVRVARLWAERRPDLEFSIFADDDHKTGLDFLERTGAYKNPGIEAAEAAAREIGAKVAYPSSYRERQNEAAA